MDNANIRQAELRGWLMLLTFGALFVPAFTFFANSGIRFIMYTLPAFSFLYLLATSKGHHIATDNRYVIALTIYAFLPLTGSFMQADAIDKTTWISAFRPIFYLAAFIPFMLFNNKSVRVLTIIFALATLFLWITGSGTTRGDFDLGESKGPLESGLAFPLGGVLCYFLLTRQKFWAFFAFILFFLAFKRIAFGALGLVMGMMFLSYLCNRMWQWNKRTLAIIMFLLTLVAAILMNIYYYEFFIFIARLIGTEQSISYLTMGRLEEFTILHQQYGDQAIENFLFGYGAGDATRKLIEITITYPLQVHNSFLLYFYELGVVGFSLLFLAFFVIFSRSAFGLYLLSYNVIIMVTDNTFNHHYHQITYFILMSAMQRYEATRDT